MALFLRGTPSRPDSVAREVQTSLVFFAGILTASFLLNTIFYKIDNNVTTKKIGKKILMFPFDLRKAV